MNPHYWYSAAILLVGLSAVGAFSYFRNQDLALRKQKQAMEEQEAKKAEVKAEQDEQEKASNQRLQDACMDDADNYYQSYLDLNATKRGSGDSAYYWMENDKWDYINKLTKDSKELCIKQYPT